MNAPTAKDFTPATIAEMREWLMDCDWGDVDESDIAAMPASVIVRAVSRLYDGGLAGWERDTCDLPGVY